VSDIVADDRADGAVVRRVGGRRVELGRLQQRGGEVVCALLKNEHGPGPLRRNAPLGGVDGLPEPGDGLAVVALGDTPKIAQGIGGIDREIRIVLPSFRVADADV
jgi:hypothetical protein